MKTLLTLLQFYVVIWQIRNMAQKSPDTIPDIVPLEFRQPFMDFVTGGLSTREPAVTAAPVSASIEPSVVLDPELNTVAVPE